MKFTNDELWSRFQKYYSEYPSIGLALDISRMNFSDSFFSEMEPRIEKAFAEMAELEKGGIANADEQRMVGHYWLRNSALAPTAAIRREIDETLESVIRFAAEVHGGKIRGQRGQFKNLLVIGIGGSALGPQFVSQALGNPTKDRLKVFFFDNTDPDGIDKVLASISSLGQTLCVVISKSGGTKETRNGMLEAKSAYEKSGLKFTKHAVAVTGVGSELDGICQKDGWLKRFPMWDWIGGRTSEMSAVGLLPAALQGYNVKEMLKGAKEADKVTRTKTVRSNPAAQLALMWHYVGEGMGAKDMVILPYKDRLELFSRYLQQLVMESLGKELNRSGKIVNQGIAVYGNKGSTDQHAYVQQLRDGINNFFVTFIEVLKDRQGVRFLVEPNVTSGDFLSGFLFGTRQALYEKDRESITITIRDVSAFSVGVLIALYERAVGLYASFVNINAYHQPGVEAGKKAAGTVIEIQGQVFEFLRKNKRKGWTSHEIACGITIGGKFELVFKICEHLAANPDCGIHKRLGKSPLLARYQMD